VVWFSLASSSSLEPWRERARPVSLFSFLRRAKPTISLCIHETQRCHRKNSYPTEPSPIVEESSLSSKSAIHKDSSQEPQGNRCAGYVGHALRTRSFEKRETKEKRGGNGKRERVWFLGEGCRVAMRKCSRSRASRCSTRKQHVTRHGARF
jgi:hypothetical protein